MSLGRTLALCIASAALAAVAVVSVPSSAAPPERPRIAQELRSQWLRERAAAHRALSIRTVQVRRLRDALRRDRASQIRSDDGQTALALFREWPAWQERYILRRESNGGTPDAYNQTPVAGCHASGMWQILVGGTNCTWERTPYARFSPFNPYANAAAARWLWDHSGGSFCVHWRPLPWC